METGWQKCAEIGFISAREFLPRSPAGTHFRCSTPISINCPNGSGYGAVLVLKNGTVVLSGQAGDGTAISQTCGLSRLGDCHFMSRCSRTGPAHWLAACVPAAGSSIQSDGVAWVKTAGRTSSIPMDLLT